jgi:cysteinyl-tRNA synthetase
MQWPSPWGQGFPGWHLECSVMSTKYLGQPFDIHGGGLDNKFPHHECEIAQAEAAKGVQFVKYWLHNNMVTVDGQKMSKSLNNYITLKEAFAGTHPRLTSAYEPMAIRQFVLSSHYRSPLDFSDEALHAAQSGYDKLTDTVITVRKQVKNAPNGPIDDNNVIRLKELKEKFESAMNDDLNTAIALSVMFELANLANEQIVKGATGETLTAIDNAFTKMGDDVLGIVKEQYPIAKTIGAEMQKLEKLLDTLMKKRKEARKSKKYELSDSIRDAIVQSDIEVIDEPDGTSGWRIK